MLDYAQIAYEAYARALNLEPSLTWARMPPRHQHAWEAAAAAVHDAVGRLRQQPKPPEEHQGEDEHAQRTEQQAEDFLIGHGGLLWARRSEMQTIMTQRLAQDKQQSKIPHTYRKRPS